MKANSMQKTLVFLAVLAAVVSAGSCYSAEEEYDVTYYDEADGYDASYFPEEADAGSASSEGSDTYGSTGDEDGYDEGAFEEEAPVLRAPVVRQLPELDPTEKCKEECAKLKDERQKECCPEWCRQRSVRAKRYKDVGYAEELKKKKAMNSEIDVSEPADVEKRSWRAVEQVNQGEQSVWADAFLAFISGPECDDFLNFKPGRSRSDANAGRVKPGRSRANANAGRVKPGRSRANANARRVKPGSTRANANAGKSRANPNAGRSKRKSPTRK